jgi:hypothetical protein
MLSMLDVAVACGLPLGPLLDSCLRAVARWQVSATVHDSILVSKNSAGQRGGCRAAAYGWIHKWLLAASHYATLHKLLQTRAHSPTCKVVCRHLGWRTLRQASCNDYVSTTKVLLCAGD